VFLFTETHYKGKADVKKCADGDEGLRIRLKKCSKGGAHNLLNRKAQRSGVNSKNSVRLHEMKLLAWSQQ
jgi:hypothetical protein